MILLRFCVLFLMIRRPPRSTRTYTSFPTRRSSDLGARQRAAGSRGRRPVDRAELRPPEPHKAGRVIAGRRGLLHRGKRALRADTQAVRRGAGEEPGDPVPACRTRDARSEEHTSELQSLMRISYAVFCLKKKKTT